MFTEYILIAHVYMHTVCEREILTERERGIGSDSTLIPEREGGRERERLDTDARCFHVHIHARDWGGVRGRKTHTRDIKRERETYNHTRTHTHTSRTR
jgi:hypothetical protein